jgi:hypothetical protein
MTSVTHFNRRYLRTFPKFNGKYTNKLFRRYFVHRNIYIFFWASLYFLSVYSRVLELNVWRRLSGIRRIECYIIFSASASLQLPSSVLLPLEGFGSPYMYLAVGDGRCSCDSS